jgi:GNAT superfamily N-acetyltransferase
MPRKQAKPTFRWASRSDCRQWSDRLKLDFTLGPERTFVAKLGKEVVGIAYFYNQGIERLFVLPEHRHKGVGTALLNNALRALFRRNPGYRKAFGAVYAQRKNPFDIRKTPKQKWLEKWFSKRGGVLLGPSSQVPGGTSIDFPRENFPLRRKGK